MDDEYDDLTREQEIARNIGYTDAGLPRGLNFIDTPQGRMTTNWLNFPRLRRPEEGNQRPIVWLL